MSTKKQTSNHLVCDALLSVALGLLLIATAHFAATTEVSRQAQDLRAGVTDIRTAEVEIGEGETVPITASIGVAVIRKPLDWFV